MRSEKDTIIYDHYEFITHKVAILIVLTALMLMPLSERLNGTVWAWLLVREVF